MAGIEKADGRPSVTTLPASPVPASTETTGFPFGQQSKPKLTIDPQSDGKQSRLRRFQLKRVISVVFGILWLGPAITLLVLNFKGYIVGAGIGCRGSGCRIDPYSTNQVQQTQALDKKNHDALGALQLVAKALEMWFMFVAGNLVFNIALYLANDNKLPMDMLTMYAEFMDILYLKALFEKLVDIIKERKSDGTFPATTNRILVGAPSGSIAAIVHSREEAQPQTVENAPILDPKEVRKLRHKLYCFIAFVAILCIVANLMGVATAVLVLPTLQWLDINHQDGAAFGALKSSSSPSDTIATGCTADALAAGNYSCTFDLYAASLDELITGASSSNSQLENRKALVLPPISQENSLTFSLNISRSATTIWVPNRQALRDFSVDLTNFYSATTTGVFDAAYAESGRFNQSLQSRLQRKGPTVGMTNDCVLGNIKNITVSDTKSVYCFPRANDDKCIRWGPGWADTPQSSAKFLIQDITPGQAHLTTTIFASAQAAYLVNDPCVEKGSCDWDAVFAATPSPEHQNISSSQLSFQYRMPKYSNLTVLCDTSSYLSFANYVLNPSPLANILNLVELDVLDDSPSGPPKYSPAAIVDVHPDWFLAAWSVNRLGAVQGERGAASQMIKAIQQWFTFGEKDTKQYAVNFNSMHQYTIVQALSMLTYSTTPLASSADRRAQAQNLKTNPKTAATLNSWATVQLWKYGIDSRTSKIGITIMLIGCVCVLARTLLIPEKSKGILEIVVTALQHEPPPPEVEPIKGRVAYNRRTSSFMFPASPTSPPGSPMR